MSTIKESDHKSGVETLYHTDGDNIAIERVQDTQGVLDEIREIKDITNGISLTKEMYHVARIPAIIVEKYCNENSVSYHEFLVGDKHITKILNDPDYAAFRIWEGRA